MLKSLVQTQNQTSYSLHLHFIGSKEQLFVSIGDSMASAGGLNLDPDTLHGSDFALSQEK